MHHAIFRIYHLGFRSVFLFAIFCALASTQAKASVLFILEPYAGLGKSNGGQQELSFYDGTTAKTDVDYLSYMTGFRASLFKDGLWIGADYNFYPSQEVTSTTATGSAWTWNSVNITEEKYDVIRNHFGVNVGFRRQLIAWVSYYPYAVMTVDTSSANDPFHIGDELAGNAYGVGLGYTFYKHFILSGEYRHYEYEDDGTQASTLPAGMKYNFISDEVLVTVSFPFAWGL